MTGGLDTQVLSGLTLLLYVLGQVVPGTESVLAIKATNTYGAHSYVWNVFTASFFNTSIIMVPLRLLASPCDIHVRHVRGMRQGGRAGAHFVLLKAA